MILSSTTKQGSIAEAFVCYDMAKYGIRVAACPFECAPYDLIAEHNGTIIKVQVKSTAKTARTNTYQFNMGRTDLRCSDLIAYVALDRNIICYRRPENITAKSSTHWLSHKRMIDYGDLDLLEIFNEIKST